MYRKTGHDPYRKETLRFVKAQQSVFPYYGWQYGMEALLETNEPTRHTAACKAQYLDAASYFLSQAKVKNLEVSSCRSALAPLLQ
jgi:hypothetical protein